MMSEGTQHKQVPIAWEGRYAEVDEDLAPLILSLWKAGIDTSNSCQENKPGIAWIQFPTMLDAKRFLDLVAVYPDESEFHTVDGRRYYVGDVPFGETLYCHIAGYGDERNWQYDVNVDDWGVEQDIVNDEVVETCIGPSDFHFWVSVRFPRTDLPLILERLQAVNGPESIRQLAGRGRASSSVPADGHAVDRGQDREGGTAPPKSTRNCPVCGAQPGTEHQPGCDVEQCRNCGWQART